MNFGVAVMLCVVSNEGLTGEFFVVSRCRMMKNKLLWSLKLDIVDILR